MGYQAADSSGVGSKPKRGVLRFAWRTHRTFENPTDYCGVASAAAAFGSATKATPSRKTL